MVDIIISWVAELIGELLDEVITLLAPLLGFSFQRFVNTFPYANTVYLIFQRCALGIVLVISVVHLWNWLFPSDARSRVPPLRAAYSVIVAVGFIYFGNYLLEGILNLCIYPYEAILKGSADKGGFTFNYSMGDLLQDAFAGFSLVLYIIVFIMIAVAFLKLMLESVERYIVLFLLVYASPLPAATLASDATSGIYKKFFSMFISQCILMVLNIWILKLCISMFENLSTNSDKFLALLMGWGLLKVGARMDSYLNQLGLNAAVTGVGLANEIGAVAGGLMMAAGMGGKGGSGGFGKGSGGENNLMNATKKFTSAVDKFNPISALGRGVKNYGGAALKSTLGKDGLVGAAVNRAKGNTPAPKGTWQQNFKKNMSAAGKKTQEQNTLARAIGGFGKSTAASFRNGAISSEDRENVATYSHAADRIFQSAAAGDAAVTEPESVGAVMQGIGFEETSQSAGEFIDAAYGNSHAENVDFTLDDNGISASFDLDGKNHSANIIGAEQFEALPYEKQQGYTEFTSDNGNKYYYHTSTSHLPKPPSAAQQAAADFTASAQKFASHSGGAMSSKDFSYMEKHPETVNQVFDGLSQSGVKIREQEQVGYMLQSMKTSGIPQAAKTEAVNALFAGETDRAVVDGTGLHVAYTDNNGKLNNISVLTESRMNELGAEYIANRGYTRVNIDGRQYGFLYEKGNDSFDFGHTDKQPKN